MQGYGLYCFEELLHSGNGHLLSTTTSSYKVPSFLQCPRQFNVHLVDKSTNEHSIFNSKVCVSLFSIPNCTRFV